MRCLLVDDEPGIRDGLAILLRRRGHEVHTAGDCAEAGYQLGERSFDVVVTDWRLPDGRASAFVPRCTAPVIAVSGHPEEIGDQAGLHCVLTKPVAPARLLAAIAAAAGGEPRAGDPAPTAVELRLPADVRAVVDDFIAQLPDGDGAVPEIDDDGVFLTLCVELPHGYVPAVRTLGGDLRVVHRRGGRSLQLVLCRDGRPDPSVPMARVDEPWPDGREIAIDCDRAAADEGALLGWLSRAAGLVAAGVTVQFCNIPEHLADVVSRWERTHGVPMRNRVGPRLPRDLAELWS